MNIKNHKPDWTDLIEDTAKTYSETAQRTVRMSIGLSSEERTKNAIKWIDALDPKEGFKKTTGSLGKPAYNKIPDERFWLDMKDRKAEGKYCCLGVACVVLDVLKQEDNETPVFGTGYDQRLENLTGMNGSSFFFDHGKKKIQMFRKLRNENDPESYFGSDDCNSLMRVNDVEYRHDADFSNMHEFILSNLSLIFIPEVAEKLKEHYSR